MEDALLKIVRILIFYTNADHDSYLKENDSL